MFLCRNSWRQLRRSVVILPAKVRAQRSLDQHTVVHVFLSVSFLDVRIVLMSLIGIDRAGH